MRAEAKPEVSLHEGDPAILEAYLAGHTTPKAMASALALEGQERDISRLLDSVPFQKLVFEAQRDLVASVVARFKRKVHQWAAEMESLAWQNEDKRVKFQAVKDLLDRAGLAPTQRVDWTSPEAYRQVLATLLVDKPGEEPSSSPTSRIIT